MSEKKGPEKKVGLLARMFLKQTIVTVIKDDMFYVFCVCARPMKVSLVTKKKLIKNQICVFITLIPYAHFALILPKLENCSKEVKNTTILATYYKLQKKSKNLSLILFLFFHRFHTPKKFCRNMVKPACRCENATCIRGALEMSPFPCLELWLPGK